MKKNYWHFSQQVYMLEYWLFYDFIIKSLSPATTCKRLASENTFFKIYHENSQDRLSCCAWQVILVFVPLCQSVTLIWQNPMKNHRERYDHGSDISEADLLWIFQLHLFFTVFFSSAVSHLLFFSHPMTLHLQYLAQSLWRWYDIMITFGLKSAQMLSIEQQEYRQRRDGAHKRSPNSLKLQLTNLLQALNEAVEPRWGCIRAHREHTFVSVHTFL